MLTTRRTPRPLRLAAVGAGTLLALLAPVLTSTAEAAPSTRLSAEALRAGLQPGNATMGWRERALARPEAGGTAKAYAPSGVLGIDVSSYQGDDVNWARYKSQGKSFAYVKATEGTSYKNPSFPSQYNGSSKAGLIRGAYHFASPNGKAGYLQARYFVANGGGWTSTGARTLPGVLDIEYNPYKGSTCYDLSASQMVSWIGSFTAEYKKLTGRDALIYTTLDWWSRCTGNTTKFSATNPLWVARYGTSSPGTLPGSWKTAVFWQYSSEPVDQDRFYSTYGRLRILAAGSPFVVGYVHYKAKG